MKQNEADRLAENLVMKFGLSLKASLDSGPEGQLVLLEPEGIHPNEGFKVNIQVGWRSLFLDLIPGKFAAELLHEMGSCSLEKKQIFSSVAKHILDEKGSLKFKINGI